MINKGVVGFHGFNIIGEIEESASQPENDRITILSYEYYFHFYFINSRKPVDTSGNMQLDEDRELLTTINI